MKFIYNRVLKGSANFKYANLVEFFYTSVLWFLAGGVFFLVRFLGEDLSSIHYLSNIPLFFVLWILSSMIVAGCFLLVNLIMDRATVFEHTPFLLSITIRTLAMVGIGFINVCVVAWVSSFNEHVSFQEEIRILLLHNPNAVKFFGIFLYASLVYSALFQFHKVFGLKMAFQVITGYYKKPRQGKFLFMFIDLNDFTTITEKIGHKNVALLLNDCFSLFSRHIHKYQGSIYSYVGDAIIVFWDLQDGLKHNNYLNAIMNFLAMLENNREYFERTYGCMPQFKIGGATGDATGYEVGSINKKEIIYLGDVLNTSARLLSLQKELRLNPHTERIFITNDLREQSQPLPQGLEYKDLGNLHLKGKQEGIQVTVIVPSVAQHYP